MLSGETKLEAKIVLIGASFVGKSSIALSYKEGRYDSHLKPTVGASYFLKNVGFKDGGNMRLHIWDTGGSEKYKTMTSLYYRGAHAALVVYSVSDENSF
jgi:small GTP-binding protein